MCGANGVKSELVYFAKEEAVERRYPATVKLNKVPPPPTRHWLRQLSQYVACVAPHMAVQFATTAPLVGLPAMLDDRTLNLSGAAFTSLLLSVIAGVNAAGKAVTGPLIDKVGPRAYLLVAMPLLAFGSICCSFAQSQEDLLFGIVLMTLPMSGSWSAETKVVSTYFEEGKWASMLAFLSAASKISVMCTKMVLGALLSSFGWRGLLHIGAVVVCLGWVATLPLLPRQGESSSTRKRRADLDKGEQTFVQRMRAMLTDPRMIVQALALVGATSQASMENTIAMLLKDFSGVSADRANILSAAFPAGLFISVTFVCPWFSRLAHKRSQLMFEVGLQLVALVSILGMVILTSPEMVLQTQGSSWLAPALNGLATTFAVGIALSFFITPQIFAFSFGDDAATAASVLNSAGLAGSVGFQSACGAIFLNGGTWHDVLRLLLVVSSGVMVCTLVNSTLHKPKAKLS